MAECGALTIAISDPLNTFTNIPRRCPQTTDVSRSSL